MINLKKRYSTIITKSILSVFSALMVFSLVPQNMIFAHETENTPVIASINSEKKNPYSKEFLKEIGLTNKQINDFYNSYTDNHSELNRGAITTGRRIISAVRKAYQKLPAPVRKKINAYVHINVFFKIIETYTGTVHNIIYKACRAIGMNDFWANFTANTFDLLI